MDTQKQEGIVELRKYQEVARKAALRDLRKKGRALIVLATGLGKTVTAAHVARDFCSPEDHILWLVHQNSILLQAKETFHRLFPGVEIGVVNGESKELDAQIVFATFQTMQALFAEVPKDRFRLAVVDESHHAEAGTYAPVVEHFIADRLGLTATPDRMDGKDIRRLFGKESYSLMLPEALARGLLPRVTYHFVNDGGFDREALLGLIRRVVDEGDRKVTLGDINRTVFIPARDEKIVEILEENPVSTIVFAHSIAHANRLAEMLPFARAYHSHKSDTTNNKTLELLKEGEIRYVVSVDGLNEGVSVPSVKRIAFLRATQSPTIYYQQLGRGLHSGGDEIEVFDFVGSVERLIMGKDLQDAVKKPTPGDGDGPSKKTIEADLAIDFRFVSEMVDILDLVGCIQTEFYTYEEAQEVVRLMEIDTPKQYELRYNEDPRLPSRPHKVYKFSWVSWPVFLGTNPYAYEEACLVVRRMEIKAPGEYRHRYKEDPRLPSDPRKIYESSWVSWGVFLAREEKPRFYTYEEACGVVRQKAVKTPANYLLIRKEDPRLPSDPARVYKSSWVSWSAFLGTEFYTYEEACGVVRQMKVENKREYERRYKEDPRLPSDPSATYKSSWVSWPVFLGTNPYVYEEACDVVRRMAIGSVKEYERRRKEDPRLPSDPRRYYKSLWPGWDAFLGKEKKY